jgi:SAM-dependent methyltransferase
MLVQAPGCVNGATPLTGLGNINYIRLNLGGSLMRPWYERLFTDYAETYDKEDFTKGTIGEVDFIEREIRRDKRLKILDVGCGTGRHAIELAKRGYDVTGLDLSSSQLARAADKAEAAGVRVRWIRRDARAFRFKTGFDLVIMLCEGGFSLMETDEENFRILENCARALRKRGKLILTMLNALFPLARSVEEFMNASTVTGRSRDYVFDMITLRSRSVFEVVDDKGRKKTLRCNERYYMPSEITWMLRSLGFRKIGVFGCTLGAFSRKAKPTPADYEILAVAEK